MYVRTSSTTCICQRRGSAETKGHRNLPTDVRALAQKLVCKVDYPQVQRVHQENAERMLLVAFVSCLIGVLGRQCRFSNPQNIQQALSIALTVEQAEK